MWYIYMYVCVHVMCDLLYIVYHFNSIQCDYAIAIYIGGIRRELQTYSVSDRMTDK